MEIINFSKCTQDFLKENFGLKRVLKHKVLNDWFEKSEQQIIDDVDTNVLLRLQNRLLLKSEFWNEVELSEHFIGPVLSLIDFNTEYFSAFADRTIEAEIGEYKFIGKPDFMIASGDEFPKIPLFCFQEYKKQTDPEGNPNSQAVAEMFAAFILNNNQRPIYGVSVIGQAWQFIVFDNKEYCLSKKYNADDEEIFLIFKTLKALKKILLGYFE